MTTRVTEGLRSPAWIVWPLQGLFRNRPSQTSAEVRIRPVLLQIPLHTDPEDCPRLCRPCIVCTYLYNLYKGVPPLGLWDPQTGCLERLSTKRHKDPGDEIWCQIRETKQIWRNTNFDVHGYTNFWSVIFAWDKLKVNYKEPYHVTSRSRLVLLEACNVINLHWGGSRGWRSSIKQLKSCA